MYIRNTFWCIFEYLNRQDKKNLSHVIDPNATDESMVSKFNTLGLGIDTFYDLIWFDFDSQACD